MAKIEMPPNWELVLDLPNDKKPDKKIWHYYFVDHESRALFWLQPFIVDPDVLELPWVESDVHICVTVLFVAADFADIIHRL